MNLIKIKDAVQAIQDQTIMIPGLNNFEMRNPELYWQLGIAIQSYLKNKNVDINFWFSALPELEKYEKEIREKGNTWIHPRNKKPPQRSWMALCLNFVVEFEDKKRWDLVASLSGDKFKEVNKNQFTQRFAEDLISCYSKKNPIIDAEKKQKLFEEEIEKFSRKPTLVGEWRPLIQKIFGKDRILQDVIDKVTGVYNEIETVLDNKSERIDLRNNIGLDTINNIRKLLQLAQVNYEKMLSYKKKINLPSKVVTKHDDVQSLYVNLLKIINNRNKSKSLRNKESHRMRLLDNYLKAIRSDDDYSEYMANKDLLKSFFS